MHTTQKPKDTKTPGATAATPRVDDKKMEDKKQESKPSDKDSKNRSSKR